MSSKKNILLIGAAAVVIAAMIVIVCFAGNGSGKSDSNIVGIIMTGSRDEGGWNTSHYDGAAEACGEFGAKLIAKENVPEFTGGCPKAIDELVSEGAGLIFLSSTNYTEEAAETIKKYPDVQFFCITGTMGIENLKSYFARMYQARYVSGVIAALQSETRSLGYVAAERNSEVIRGIDAFALGAQSVRPDIEVNVIFTGGWDNGDKERAAADRLINGFSADVIAYHQNLPNAAEEADRQGVYSIGYHEKAEGLSDRYLTSIVWNWKVIYREIIKDQCQKNQNARSRYWLGLESRAAVLTELSPLVNEEAKNAAKEAENRIISGKDVFSGLILDNEGNVRCREDEAISDEILFSEMDWFVSGVKVHDQN